MSERYITLTAAHMSWLKIIPPAQHGLWLTLHWYGGSDGQVWASRATLADMVGISERSISRGLRALESCRAISLVERNGQTSLIQLLGQPTLDTSVNPPLTEVSTPPLTEMSTPLDESVKGPLTEVSTKEEKEEDKRKTLLVNKTKEEQEEQEAKPSKATSVLTEMDWHCVQLFKLYEKFSNPDGPLGHKHWRCTEDTTFMDWYSALPIPPTEWHSNAWQRTIRSIDGWMDKQAQQPDGGRAWRYEYWQKGIVAWLERNAPKKPVYNSEPPQPTPEQKAVHNSLSRADNEWLSMLALGMEQGQPSEAIKAAMLSYPDDNMLKQIYQNKYC